MSCARVASASSTKTSRAGPGRTVGWPPRKRPTQSATRALAAAITGVRKRGFMPPLTVARAEKASIKAAGSGSQLHPEETPQGQAGAEGRHHHAGREEDRDQQPEVDRVRRG